MKSDEAGGHRRGQGTPAAEARESRPSSLETGATSVDLVQSSAPGLASNRIAYQLNGTSVIDVNADGSDRQVIPGATLVGLSFGPTLSYGSALAIDYLFLSRPDASGGTAVFSRVPGASGSMTQLGVLPPEFTTISVASLFTGTAVVTAQAALQADIYVVTEAAAGSLHRVTDTPSAFEIGIL